MPFLILPKDAKENPQLAKFTDSDKITYGTFKEWRNAQICRNERCGGLSGMNFKKDSIFTTFDKQIFDDIKKQKIERTHIGIFFGSDKGAIIPGVGNFKNLSVFLTLALEQNGKITPVGDTFKGGEAQPTNGNNFQKRYIERIKRLRDFKEGVNFGEYETTGIFHPVDSFYQDFVSTLKYENTVKVIYVKDTKKTTVVFAKGSFEHTKNDFIGDDEVIGYDHGTGCCPIP